MAMDNLRRWLEDRRHRLAGRERSQANPAREQTTEGSPFSPIEDEGKERKLARISDAAIYKGLPRDMQSPYPSALSAVIDGNRVRIEAQGYGHLHKPPNVTINGKSVSDDSARKIVEQWADLIDIKARRLDAVRRTRREEKENILVEAEKHVTRERKKDEAHGSTLDNLLH